MYKKTSIPQGSKNKKPENSLFNPNLFGWLHVPTKIDVLHCLFSDGSAIDESFDFWCDSLGYDSDSIKAFDTYRACIAERKKLDKALGKSYKYLEEKIYSLGL